MSRQGVLMTSRLEDAISAVEKAFVYDIKRGSSSRGSHVRDAARYVAWAFARSFDPITLEPFTKRFADSLIVMCLFDREVNCRRAAAAAFQEIVGRQGGPGCVNMPHGIEIVTIADYSGLGNRKHSYLEICPVIASFPEYQDILLRHLLEHKVIPFPFTSSDFAQICSV
jgi:tubulin-specific chaperone D